MTHIDEIKKYFSPEAWNLFQSFLESLQAAMVSNEVDSEKQISILHDIYDFVDEFYDELDHSVLDFNTALELLTEIGSPSDVLQALNIASEPDKLQGYHSNKKRITCIRCGWSNQEEYNFCEQCGESLETIHRTTRTATYQPVIDHPYMASLIFFSFFFTFTKSIRFLFRLDFEYILSIHFLERIISPETISATIICAIISGLVFDHLLRNLKSQKAKLKQLVNSFEDNFALALILTFFSLLCISTLIVLYLAELNFLDIRQEIFLLYVPSTILSIIVLIVISLLNYSYKPLKFNYFSLLKTNNIITAQINRRMIRFNIFFILPAFMGAFLIQGVFFYFSTEYIDVFSFIFLGLFSGFSVICFSNSISLLYYYSWPYLNKHLP